jgi:hypothetical protein
MVEIANMFFIRDEPTGPEDSNEVLEYMGMHPKLCPDAIGVSTHQLLDPAVPREY